MTKSNIIIGKEKYVYIFLYSYLIYRAQLDKKKLIKLSVKRSNKEGSNSIKSITNYSTSLGSGTHEQNEGIKNIIILYIHSISH